MIGEFVGQYRFLSNFWACFIEFEGDTYPSVENAFQAAKCKNKEDRKRFFGLKATDAKKLGRVIQLRDDWEQKTIGGDPVKIKIMRQIVKQKFSTEPLRSKLLATGDEELQEGNWWGDDYWGTENGKGQNHLGKILMQVRDEIRKKLKEVK